jgi:hypothetical protein
MTSPNSVFTPEPAPAAPATGNHRFWIRLQAVLFVLFCLEVGVVLVLLPWSSFWDRNYFFSLFPGFAGVFSSSYMRGAVSGIGLLNVGIAFSELWRLRTW